MLKKDKVSEISLWENVPLALTKEMQRDDNRINSPAEICLPLHTYQIRSFLKVLQGCLIVLREKITAL